MKKNHGESHCAKENQKEVRVLGNPSYLIEQVAVRTTKVQLKEICQFAGLDKGRETRLEEKMFFNIAGSKTKRLV